MQLVGGYASFCVSTRLNTRASGKKLKCQVKLYVRDVKCLHSGIYVKKRQGFGSFQSRFTQPSCLIEIVKRAQTIHILLWSPLILLSMRLIRDRQQHEVFNPTHHYEDMCVYLSFSSKPTRLVFLVTTFLPSKTLKLEGSIEASLYAWVYLQIYPKEET